MARLGDVCEVINGFAFKSEQYVDSGIRIIRIANVQKGYLEDAAPVFYPSESKEAKKYSLVEDDILMSLTGNVGRVAKLSREFLPAALNQRVACLRIKDGVDIDKAFLFNLLNSDYFEQQCISASKGVAQKNMSTEWLKEYEIPIFSLERQRLIAGILDKTTELISLRKQQLAKLDELVKSQFVEMFGTPESVMNSSHTIAEVADVQVGIVIKPTRYYADGNEGIKAFRSLNIGPMYIKDDDWVYFTEEAMKETQRTVAHTDDILVVRSGSPGTSCVVPLEYDGCNVIDLIIAHPNKEKVLPKYLCAFTNMPHGMNQINSQQRGVAQKHFNVGMYKDLRLILPSLDEQKQFVDFLEQSDKSKYVARQATSNLRTYDIL